MAKWRYQDHAKFPATAKQRHSEERRRSEPTNGRRLVLGAERTMAVVSTQPQATSHSSEGTSPRTRRSRHRSGLPGAASSARRITHSSRSPHPCPSSNTLPRNQFSPALASYPSDLLRRRRLFRRKQSVSIRHGRPARALVRGAMSEARRIMFGADRLSDSAVRCDGCKRVLVGRKFIRAGRCFLCARRAVQ